MDSRTVHRSGTPLHGLWREGEGYPLIVVPGALADAQAFVPTVEALGRPEPVLIIDRRGRGGSGDLGKDYSLDVEVEDLLRWMDVLDSPVRLMGWSYGANIVIETAARGDVDDVVAYEPGLAPLGRSVIPRLYEADPDERVEIINRVISQVTAQEVEDLRASSAWPDLVRLAEPVADELAAMNAFDPGDRWDEVRAKLILGEMNQGDSNYGQAFRRAESRLPHSQTIIMSGQGHLAHAASPRALGRLVGELLNR